MSSIAIIPARSGSKGLPDKNIKELCGKPLIAYSIEVALASGCFDEVMVSTDSERYAQIAWEYGASVPFLRSEKNSSDTASSWDMVEEVLNRYTESGNNFDDLCLLQPTSPLRKAEDIVNAYKLFREKRSDSIIGVCEAEHPPQWMNTLPQSLSLEHFVSEENQNANRQQLGTYYRINGAIYIRSVASVSKKESVYSNSFAYIMPRNRSIDIDVELDFMVAEAIMKNQQ